MSFLDSSFSPLLPYLQSADVPTLWIADENALSALQHLEQNDYPLLSLITNRYDIYTLAKSKNIDSTFNDFNFDHFYDGDNTMKIQRVIYRVSKEKALTHHLLNQACKLLNKKNSGSLGELILSGKKQEGIKSYQKKLLDTFECKGKLKKQGLDYSGVFSNFTITKNIPDDNYTTIQRLPTPNHPHLKVYTKPGVFGWNKIDIGSELLLESLPAILQERDISPKNILDLGCGYGWIFLNLPYYLPTENLQKISVTATDNNATALLCAEKNSASLSLPTSIIPDDCAQNIDEKFDLILCNPPFHQERVMGDQIAMRMFAQAAQVLTANGEFWVVGNRHLGYHVKLKRWFSRVEQVGAHPKFVVLKAQL